MVSYRRTSLSTFFRQPTAVDLYCGSGAVTEGLRRNGFRVVAAVDSDPVASRTYRINHPTTRLYSTDIRKLSPNQIYRRDLKSQNVDLLIVCAPCQPFSSQNKNKANDPRAKLILEAARFAEALKPALIFFENVPGLTKARNQSVLQELHNKLDAAGYVLGNPQEVDAADYGVPQRRRRCVMFAVPKKCQKALPSLPQHNLARVSVRDTIGHLPRLASGEFSQKDPLHRARTHLPIALARLKHIPKDGGSRHDLPDDLVLPCHKNYRGHPDVYGRMKWDDIAPTLTTGCTDVTKGRFAHPEDNRAITAREAALLQTFPGRYRFYGNGTQVATQVGNAVPVRMIAAFSKTFTRTIRTVQRLGRAS